MAAPIYRGKIFKSVTESRREGFSQFALRESKNALFLTVWADGLMAVLVAALIWAPAQAEPNTVTKYLMNEPATMLDLGMDRLNYSLDFQKHEFIHDLDIKEAEELAFDLVAIYDLENNKIKISTQCRNCGLSANEGTCSHVIDLFREFLVPGSNVPELRGNMIHLNAATQAFHHLDFRSASEPEDIDEQLAKMMVVEVELFSHGDEATCKGGLFETGYSVKHK